jgi:hypothetical protein
MTQHSALSTEHWAERYVGRPYIEGEFDCADLARLVQQEVFKREIRLPASRDYAGKEGMAKIRAMSGQIEACKLDYAGPVATPVEGDAVLLISRAASSHIGTWCAIGGEGYVLHCTSRSKQAVLQRIRDLHLFGLKIEGFYRWT